LKKASVKAEEAANAFTLAASFFVKHFWCLLLVLTLALRSVLRQIDP
jgi:hypothetical protein